MKVKELLQSIDRPVITIKSDETVQAAINKLVEHNIGALPVCDGDEEMCGIITERDLLRECAHRVKDIEQTRVKDIMTTEVAIGTEEDDLNYVMDIMTQLRSRHLPIMRELKLQGMVSARDVVESQLKQSRERIRFLSDYTRLLTAILHQEQPGGESK